MATTSLGKVLGARVRARREALGLSQAKLAEGVGLTPNYLGSIERGEALPTLQTLVILAKVLGTPPAELLGDAGARDEWLEKIVAVAKAIAPTVRPLALAVMRTIASNQAALPRTGATSGGAGPRAKTKVHG